MTCIKFMCVSLLIFATVSNIANGYNILGLFPTVSKSHFIIGDALMRGLAEKGHNVTVISPYPMKDKLYRGIEVPSLIPAANDIFGNFWEMRNQSVVESFLQLFELGVVATNTTLNDPSVQKLMTSEQKFDLIVIDLFLTEGLFGFSDIFNAPIIGIGAFGAISWNTALVGTPSPPSYVPNPFIALTDHMTLLERIGNLVVLSFDVIYYEYFYLNRQEAIFKEHFSKSKRTLEQLRKNTALVLLNQHFTLSFPRPYLPNMIEVGGLHINGKRKPLPAAMQKFLDEAKDGAIYFSMGSNLESKYLEVDKRDAILRTFKSLKQRVLWKFEDPNLPGKSDNVFINKWFPQDDVLAHPNVRLFITHGGLLSTTESMFHAKPFIGIPIFGDQFLNMARAEANGFGITVDFKTLTEKSFKTAITEMLENPKYTKNIRDLSARFHDQPVKPMDLAVYWMEYVARHKGAPHLHCAAQELNFIQYHNLDAIAILFGGLLLVAYLFVKLVTKIILHVVVTSKGNAKEKSH